MTEERINDDKVQTTPDNLTETVNVPAADAQEATTSSFKKLLRRRSNRFYATLGIIVLVLAVSGGGFWVWHEQPSFCGAVCHTPMDPYLTVYEQEPNTQGVDKWGNEVENTSTMLAVSHKVSKDAGGADATCLSCHKPTIAEQLSEVKGWTTGDMQLFHNEAYGLVTGERGTPELTAWLGAESDTFCLNGACHDVTRNDLVKLTADRGTYNAHRQVHGANECSDCHKAHRASVNMCTQCHEEASVPEGWLTYSEAQEVASRA